MKNIIIALRLTLFMTLLLGLIYPLAMTGLAQVFFPRQAGGDLVIQNGKVIGSLLIAQNFEKSQYFWPRPSAIGFSPLPSGGTNLGPTAQALKAAVQERIIKLKAAHPEKSTEPPQELLFASASGLDPHLSLPAAQYQVDRVAKSRNMSAEQVEKLVEQSLQERQWGLFGEPTVNVLALNLALDKIQGK